MYKSLIGAVCALPLILSTSPYAATIYVNGDPDYIEAGVSDTNFPFQFADDFNISVDDYIVQDVHWSGVYCTTICSDKSYAPPTQDDDFTIYFFDESPTADKPLANPFASFNVGDVTRTLDTSTDYYYYSTLIPDLALTSNTDYWISIQNNTTGQGTYVWGWATTGFDVVDGNAVERYPGWSNVEGIEMSFSLTGTIVPIPAAVWLFGSGLLGLIGIARRKKTA
jgi:hypothetical protein